MTTIGSGFLGLGIPKPEVTPLQKLEMERDSYRQQSEFLAGRVDELTEGHTLTGTIAGVGERHVWVLVGSEMLRMRRPSLDGVERGALAMVARQPKGLAISSIVDAPVMPGETGTVVALLSDDMVEVAMGQSSRVCFAKPSLGVTEGDRVAVAGTGTAVVRNLGKASLKASSRPTGVHWDDVGGLDDVKAVLREAIEGPVKNAAAYQRFGRRPLRGIALAGPPGTGKTLLSKAAHTALAELHAGDSSAEGGFVYVKGPEILAMWVGVAEERIRAIFAAARAFRKKHGYSPIVMFDEADGIFGRRGRAAHGGGVERTLVPQVLAEMDGFDEPGPFVIVATNRPDELDQALLRPGRIDRVVHVRRPTLRESSGIFGVALRGRPLATGETTVALNDFAAETLFSQEFVLARIRCKDGRDDRRFTFGDMASGARIVDIVERAASRAMAREIATGAESGISRDDLVEATRESFGEQRRLDFTEDLADVVRKLGDKVIKVERAESD